MGDVFFYCIVEKQKITTVSIFFSQVINSLWLQLQLQTVPDSWRLCWTTTYEAWQHFIMDRTAEEPLCIPPTLALKIKKCFILVCFW